MVSLKQSAVQNELKFQTFRLLDNGVPVSADHLIPASDVALYWRCLRSANRSRLTVPRCRLSTYSCRAFDYTGL